MRIQEHHVLIKKQLPILITFSCQHPAEVIRFIVQGNAIGRVYLYFRNIWHLKKFIYGAMSAGYLFSCYNDYTQCLLNNGSISIYTPSFILYQKILYFSSFHSTFINNLNDGSTSMLINFVIQ